MPELFGLDWWQIKTSHGWSSLLCSEIALTQTCRICLDLLPLSHTQNCCRQDFSVHTWARILLFYWWSWLIQWSTGSRSRSMFTRLVTTDRRALSRKVQGKISSSSLQSRLMGSIFFDGLVFHLAPNELSESWSVAYSTADWSCMRAWKLNLELSKLSQHINFPALLLKKRLNVKQKKKNHDSTLACFYALLDIL